MNKNLVQANNLKERLESVSKFLCPGNPFSNQEEYHKAVDELSDVVLDFKTLAYKTDDKSPLYHEISGEPTLCKLPLGEHDYSTFIKRISYLLDKFIQYIAEE